jgi:hypothetical protein
VTICDLGCHCVAFWAKDGLRIFVCGDVFQSVLGRPCLAVAQGLHDLVMSWSKVLLCGLKLRFFSNPSRKAKETEQKLRQPAKKQKTGTEAARLLNLESLAFGRVELNTGEAVCVSVVMFHVYFHLWMDAFDCVLACPPPFCPSHHLNNLQLDNKSVGNAGCFAACMPAWAFWHCVYIVPMRSTALVDR